MLAAWVAAAWLVTRAQRSNLCRCLSRREDRDTEMSFHDQLINGRLEKVSRFRSE
jgi:hypothetical protein